MLVARSFLEDRFWTVAYGGEAERVDFDSERSDVLLLEFSGQMALDEGGLDNGLSVCSPLSKLPTDLPRSARVSVSGC